MHKNRLYLACSTFLACLMLAGAAGASHHEAGPAKAWDAEAIAKILERLAIETSKLQDGLAQHIKEAPKNSPRRIVLRDVSEIHHRVISIDSGVRSGLGREKTEPVFLRLLDSVRHARHDAQAFPEIQKLRRHIDKAHDYLGELEAYYDVHE